MTLGVGAGEGEEVHGTRQLGTRRSGSNVPSMRISRRLRRIGTRLTAVSMFRSGSSAQRLGGDAHLDRRP